MLRKLLEFECIGTYKTFDFQSKKKKACSCRFLSNL
jgi:hypothetical protein